MFVVVVTASTITLFVTLFVRVTSAKLLTSRREVPLRVMLAEKVEAVEMALRKGELAAVL